MALTAKQQRFVREYLIDGNATQAAIRAGYSAKTAGAIGAENLTKPEIASALEAAQVKIADRLELTAAKVLQDVEDVRKLAKQDGVYGAALKASELQAKSLGKENPFLDLPTKHQLVDENDNPVAIDDISLAQRVAFLLNRGVQAMDGESAKPAPATST